METLEKIFGGVDKVKTMRLFLFNPHASFDIQDISKRTKIPKNRVRKEVKNLWKIDLVKKKTFSKTFNDARGNSLRKKVSGWELNEKFSFLPELKNFLINITSAQYKEIMEKIKRVGIVKLLILSGVFIQEDDSRIDILIVGDKIKNSAVLSVMSEIESEVGKEIKYTYFQTDDFLYRLGVCDKLVRDILDYPHKKVINKLDI